MNTLYVICRKTKSGAVEVYKPDDSSTPAYLICTINKDYSLKPDYRNKYITLNCFKYHIMWDKG